MQPHTFGVPLPPQVWGRVQEPQNGDLVAPQLSIAEMVPQPALAAEHNAASFSGEHPHTLDVPPPPQVSGEVQPPQFTLLRCAPQLSVPDIRPHSAPALRQKVALVSEVQPGCPHTLAVPPPPQVSGEEQAPQSTLLRVEPQLSVPDTVPQLAAFDAQTVASLSGVHPHVFGVPPPPQLSGDVQFPQATVWVTSQLFFCVSEPH